MSGSIAAATMILAMLVVAALLVRIAAKRWWEYLIVFALTAVLVRPGLGITGDMSAVLPNVWSDGADGKDEVILVSIAATVLLPLMTAAFIVWAAKVIAGMLNQGKTEM